MAMPRRPRFDLPETIHHVCIRGVEGRRIFVDDVDPADLMRRFERWSLETKSPCYAWSLDGNHAHFVIARGEAPMATLMARTTSAFAQRFNRRHDRRGHLLMGRYESRRICDDADLRWMVLYAAANPVRHDVLTPAELDRSNASSWAAMMGTRDSLPFESLELPLALYGPDALQARQGLRDSLAHAVATQWAPPREAQIAAIMREACARHGIGLADLARRSGRARAARQEIIRRASNELGMSASDLARRLAASPSQIARVRRLQREPPSQ
jgi:REP element-mobilizing transposase RayT